MPARLAFRFRPAPLRPPPLELRSRPCKRNRNHGTASASRPTFLFGPRHVVHWLRWQLPSFLATSQRGPTDGSCSPGTAASSLARHSLPAEALVTLANARGPRGSETSFSHMAVDLALTAPFRLLETEKMEWNLSALSISIVKSSGQIPLYLYGIPSFPNHKTLAEAAWLAPLAMCHSELL